MKDIRPYISFLIKYNKTNIEGCPGYSYIEYSDIEMWIMILNQTKLFIK
jgi:hypothetical protein